MKILEDRGYTYKKHLSTGGEGEVHLIKSVDKEFIAKIFPVLSDDSVDVLRTIQKLNIKGIPQIHDIFNHEDKTIIIRDYVDGTTLYDEIRKNEYLSFKRAKTILFNICQTLKQLHNARPNPIIYRDLKPENIIVTPAGEIQLIDFGIARYYKREQTRDTVLAGTKGYTAPEVMAGMQSDQRSDIYSAGLVFYEMITGKSLLTPPFQVRPVKESNEYLPEWVDDVIKKATDISQTRRYKTIDEFVSAIENPVMRKETKSKRKIIIGGAIALGAVVVIGGIIFAMSKLDVFNEKETAAPTESIAATADINNTAEADAQINYTDKDMVVHKMLKNPVMMFEETKEQLIANKGELIGTEADKRQSSSDGVVFTADPGQDPYMPFLLKLDNFGNTMGGNQAFYIKFKPAKSNFIVELSEQYCCGLSSNDQGEIELIVGAYDYVETLSTIRYTEDSWYNALIAMGADGLVQGAVWLDGQEQQAIYANLHIDKSFGGDNYSQRSWQANVGYMDEIIINQYAYFTFDDFNIPERQIDISHSQGTYENLLDLQFDELYDTDWIYLIRDLQYNEPDEGNFDELTHDSLFDVKYEFGMSYRFKAGDIYHIRIKPGAADDLGTLLLLCFAPHIDETWHEDSYELKFENKQPFAGEVRTDTGYYYENAQGHPMIVSNRWYDVVVYLDENNTFKYFIFESENSSKMVCGGALAMEYWTGLEYEIYVDLYHHQWQGNGRDMPISQVDFIKHSRGSIGRYLMDNIESYEDNETEINVLLMRQFGLVSEDKFITHGN